MDLDGASVCLIRYPGIGRGAGAILSRGGVCLPCPGRGADRAALDDPATVRVVDRVQGNGAPGEQDRAQIAGKLPTIRAHPDRIRPVRPEKPLSGSVQRKRPTWH